MKFFLTLIFISVFSFAHDFVHTPWDLLVQIKIERTELLEQTKKLAQQGLDIAGIGHRDGTIDLLINNAQYKQLLDQGYQIEIKEVHGVSAAPDKEYKTPQEIEEILKSISRENPDITQLVSLGKSLEGRDIWAIKISDNAQLDESHSEPRVLFNSMHHAREVMTPEIALDIIEQLIDGYKKGDATISRWVEGLEVWVLPMFNVDGNHKMWTVDRWWRKNTRNGHGVDLNRNYPSTWNKCRGSSGLPSSQTYRGSSAGSEPETQVMMKFISEIRPVFNISYHSYSEIVIYPFGCSSQRTPTKDIVEGIGKEIGKRLDYEAGTSWELLYDVDGGDIDWMYQAYGVIPYVIEVNSSREGFHPRYSQWRDVTVERNRAGWQFLLDRSLQSGVRGTFSNSNGLISDYVVKVMKNGKLYQEMKSQGNGAFHLVLNPGKYSLQFVADNAQVQAETEVQIESELLVLDMKI